MPYVLRNASDAPLTVDFLAELVKTSGGLCALQEHELSAVFDEMLANFEVANLTSSPEGQYRIWPGGETRARSTLDGPTQIERHVDPKSASSLFHELVHRDKPTLASNLLNSLVNACIKQASSHSSLYFKVLFPFLQRAISNIQIQGERPHSTIDQLNNAFREPLLTSFTAIREAYVGPCPEPPGDWRIPRLPCDCRRCAEISNSFNESQQDQFRYQAVQYYRLHAEEKFRNLPVFLRTEQSPRPSIPDTLVVTKVLDNIAHRQRMWLHRIQENKNVVQMFPQEDLKFYLRGDYERTGIPALLAFNSNSAQPMHPIFPASVDPYASVRATQCNGDLHWSLQREAYRCHVGCSHSTFWRPGNTFGRSASDSPANDQENLSSSVPAKRKAESPAYVDLT